MEGDNVIEPKKPEIFIDDPIVYILYGGARKLLTGALFGGRNRRLFRAICCLKE